MRRARGRRRVGHRSPEGNEVRGGGKGKVKTWERWSVCGGGGGGGGGVVTGALAGDMSD